MKPDIFKPRVILERIGTAGMVYVESSSGMGVKFEVNGGCPFQHAYNEAFALAISSSLPLWTRKGLGYELLYHPDLESLDLNALKEEEG